MKKINFLAVLFSLFLMTSCHTMHKKTGCSSKYQKGSKCKTSRAEKRCDKKSYKRWGKKCGKKYYKKCGKQACYGQAEVAGFSEVKDVTGGKITGSVLFEATDKYMVKVTANIKGLAPNKKFGFHVHEFGNCKNKGLLAGGHLNPWGSKHAGPKAKDRHLGDLGNIESDKTGTAVYTVSVKGKLKSFMGRSVIIHAQMDDMKSQPTGNAGKRIACGVITASMPPVPESVPEQPSASETKKVPAKKMISTDNKASAEKAVSTDKKVSAEKAVSTDKKVSVKKAVSSDSVGQIQKANKSSDKKTY